MNLLALELSTARGSLAWYDHTGESVTVSNWPNDRRNSALFFENLKRTIGRFGRPDAIVIGLGPGSYAGVRIAISAAIGLAADRDCELLGFPSVCAVETSAERYSVVGDARRHSFFVVRIEHR